MIGYRFALCCPDDGAPVEHVADGVPSPGVVQAVAACTECGRRWAVRVALIDAGKTRKRNPAIVY